MNDSYRIAELLKYFAVLCKQKDKYFCLRANYLPIWWCSYKRVNVRILTFIKQLFHKKMYVRYKKNYWTFGLLG